MVMIAGWEPIGARVRQARLGRSLSQEALGAIVDIDRPAVARLEAGERKISALELMALADALSVPMSWLTELPEPAIASHRQPLDDSATTAEARQFTADVLLDQAWREVDQLRRYGFIAPVGDLPTALVTGDAQARVFAHRVRQHLGLGSDPLGPLSDLAARLGLFVTVVDADIEGAALTPEPGLGVAVIGAGLEPGRRRMTTSHELGHHLLGDEYSSDLGVSSSRDEREVIIDAFASEFLLPSTAFAAHDSLDRTALVDIAARYRVSWGVAVRGAAAAGAITEADRRCLSTRAPVRAEIVAAIGSDVPPDLLPGTRSSAWATAVLAALREGCISQGRALELLHDPSMTPGDLPDGPDDAW